MNKAILIGNLARDPETMTTSSGITKCNFTVAVQRRFANQQGVREADFIPPLRGGISFSYGARSNGPQ